MAKKFTIRGARHTGKHIEVLFYKKHASGVEIKITHNVPVEAGKQLRWVQTVEENGSFFNDCGQMSYVDPFGIDANWTSTLPSMPARNLAFMPAGSYIGLSTHSRNDIPAGSPCWR